MVWASQGSADINSAIRTQIFGGPQQAAVPRCRVILNSTFTQTNAMGDVWAQSGWVANIDPMSMFLPFVSGSNAQIILPFDGQWQVDLDMAMSTTAAPAFLVNGACKVSINAASVAACIASDKGVFVDSGPDGLYLKAKSRQPLVKGTRIFWSSWVSSAAGTVTVPTSVFGNVLTAIDVRYLGPST